MINHALACPHYPEGPVPTSENTTYLEWKALLNAALYSIRLCSALDFEARAYFECGYTPKGASDQVARECGINPVDHP